MSVNKTIVYATDPYNSNSKKSVSIGTPKTKAGYRIIPLIPDIVDMLREHKELQGAIVGNVDYVFCTMFNGSAGQLVSASSIDKVIRRTAKKAGIENLSAHCLRHTFATRGLENGIPLKVMQELLGHSSIKMTADLYTHVLPETKQAEIMKLADTIRLDVPDATLQ